MQRPSFQFYPGDWSSNKNLKRCSFHLKGIWIDVMCLMHDSEEYGILRWTLQEIACAVKCTVDDLNDLRRYEILKGSENPSEKVSFSPSFAQRKGYPRTVTLIDSYGPLFYSSRMVRDEYVRQKKAEYGIKSLDNPNVPRKKALSKNADKDTFSGTDKDTFSPSSSSSSSSSSNNNTYAANVDKDTISPFLSNKVCNIQYDYQQGIFVGIQQGDIQQWQEAYPAIDVNSALLRAAQWLKANPKNRKKNMRRFITNWLCGDQEKSPGKGTGAQEQGSKKRYDRDRYREDPEYHRKVNANRDLYY